MEESGELKAEQRQQPVTPTAMESGEVKAEQRQPPVTPKKRRRPAKPTKSAAQANGGSSSSAAGSSLSSRTSSSSPPSDGADGKGQQQQQQGGGGKKPRLVWTEELHGLFVEVFDSLGDEAVPMKILEKMNEKTSLPEVSREKVASHLQKHKMHMRRNNKPEEPLGVEASSRSLAEEAPASHPVLSLPPNTAPLAEVYQAQLQLVHQVLQVPPDCLSRSGSSFAANLQSIQLQQLCGHPIKEGQAQPAETMQGAPADSGCSLVGMETSTAAILVPEANTEAVMIRMAPAAQAENAAEPEAAPDAGILGQFWASPDDNEAPTSSWDIFGLSPRT